MHLHQANLTNLTGLWKKYGAQQIMGNTLPCLYANTHWPHRCWFDWETLSDNNIQKTSQRYANNNTILDKVPESAIMPVWPMMSSTNDDEHTIQFEQPFIEKQLIAKKWLCEFEQVAMYLEVPKEQTVSLSAHTGFRMSPVRTSEQIKAWADIGSEAFSYHIDYSVIEPLIRDKDMQILLGFQDGQAVASALLYKTGETIGLHQVGVKRAFQGKGIARRFMQEIIATCVRWQGKYVVLQASEAGQPLYSSLGFRMQFHIRNYQKI